MRNTVRPVITGDSDRCRSGEPGGQPVGPLNGRQVDRGDPSTKPAATPSLEHDGNSLAHCLGSEPACCGGGPCDDHAAWCAWGRLSLPTPVLGEAVGIELCAGRYSTLRACGRCFAPKGEGCWVSPLPGPVVDLDQPRPVTVAGGAAGWS